MGHLTNIWFSQLYNIYLVFRKANRQLLRYLLLEINFDETCIELPVHQNPLVLTAIVKDSSCFYILVLGFHSVKS